MIWTAELIETCQTLWKAGLSASRIAVELNCGVGRNGVIGKLHRMGLTSKDRHMSRPVQTMRVRRSKPKTNSQFSHARTSPPAPHSGTPRGSVMPPGATPFVDDAPEPIDVPVEQRKTIATIERDMCRWPIGSPQSPEFFFCGGATEEGEPYCIGHSMLAFNAPTRVNPNKAPYHPQRLLLNHNGNYRTR
jgi:GcrA cell cycle regulator